MNWLDGSYGDWTWKEVSDETREVAEEFEALTPPDGLEEYHEATLVFFERIADIAGRQDPGGNAHVSHLMFEPSALEAIEKLEEAGLSIDPETLDLLEEHQCGE